MRSARLLDERFEPRPELKLESERRTATVRFSAKVARWHVERGARPLKDGAALEELAFGSVEWLVGELLSFRGDGVVVEPQDLRGIVAKRARELQRELAPPRARR